MVGPRLHLVPASFSVAFHFLGLNPKPCILALKTLNTKPCAVGGGPFILRDGHLHTLALPAAAGKLAIGPQSLGLGGFRA